MHTCDACGFSHATHTPEGNVEYLKCHIRSLKAHLAAVNKECNDLKADEKGWFKDIDNLRTKVTKLEIDLHVEREATRETLEGADKTRRELQEKVTELEKEAKASIDRLKTEMGILVIKERGKWLEKICELEAREQRLQEVLTSKGGPGMISVLMDRFRGGESVADLEDDYGLERGCLSPLETVRDVEIREEDAKKLLSEFVTNGAHGCECDKDAEHHCRAFGPCKHCRGRKMLGMAQKNRTETP